MFIQACKLVDLEKTNPLRQHIWWILCNLWAHIYWSCPTNSKTITYRNSVSPQYCLICFIEHGGWSLRSVKSFASNPSVKGKWRKSDHTGFVDSRRIWFELHYFWSSEFTVIKNILLYYLLVKSCNDSRWVMVGTAMSAWRHFLRFDPKKLLRKNMFKVGKIQK